MTAIWPESCFDGAHVATDSPPLQAYGLAPDAATGYRLADLSVDPAPERPWSEGRYSQAAVALVLSGAFEFAGDGPPAAVIPGALVFANPKEGFLFRRLAGQGNRRIVLFFAPEVVEAVANDLGLEDPRFPLVTAPPSRLTPAVAGLMLRIARRPDPEGGVEAAAAIAETALRGVEDRRCTDKLTTLDERRIVDVVRYVDAHFASPCGLDALAAIAGMSRFRFARRFRAVTGETAAQYVLERRLSAAAARLLATRASVLEIACEVGFNDLSHFYQCFRSAFGCAPAAWRRGGASASGAAAHFLPRQGASAKVSPKKPRSPAAT